MNRLLFFAFSVFFTGCSINENIIDTRTGEKIAGYDHDCKFRIGYTKWSDISVQQLEALKKENLGFRFSDDPTLGVQKGVLKTIGAGGVYATSKGVREGDSAKNAEKIYGKPEARILDYGEDGNVHWILHGLFYKKLSIFTDTSLTTVIGFTVGRELDLDKRFIRKK